MKLPSVLKYLQINSDRKAILSFLLSLSLILLMAYPYLYPSKANATVNEAFVRFDRLAAITSGTISGTACLKSSLTSQTNVTITFPSGWTISGTAANWTTSTGTLPVDPAGGAVAAWPSIGSPASSVSGRSVTFTGGNFSLSTTLYCFNFSGTSSSTVAGNDQVGQLKTQGGSPFTDSVAWATSTVSAGPPAADQISVTASVSATMTFSLSGTSTDLGTLVTSSTPNASSPTITQSVSTNAHNGWVSWVKSTNGALNSAASGGSISSPGSFDGAPETLAAQSGYVLDVNTNSCSGCTIAAEYNGADTSSGGHLDAAASGFRQTASHTVPASSETVDLVLRAKASATTPAANDYTDTLTVVAAGSF